MDQDKDRRVTVNVRVDASTGFTLVEIMIVVAIIGLLAALMLPNFVKSRKQTQGRRIMNDVRQLDTSISQWAVETGQSDGAPVDTAGASSYLKTRWPSTDLLGNTYRIRNVGTNQVSIARRTKSRLAGVGIDWGPY